MKQDKDWIDVVRSELRDAETPPPAGGWARLERELGTVPAPRVPAWRIHWPRIAAAAAAVVICVAAGEYLWHADTVLKGYKGDVITTTVSGGATAEPVNSAASKSAEETMLAAVTPENRAIAPARDLVPKRSETLSIPPATIETAADTQSAAPQIEQTPDPDRQASSESDPAKSGTGGQSQPSRQVEAKSSGMSSQRQRRTLMDDDFVAYTPPRKKASFSLYGGGAVTGGSATNGAGSGMSANMSDSPLSPDASYGGSISLMRQFDYARGSFRHHQPLSFGLSVRKEFAYGLSLESGVNYTLLRSDVSLFSGAEEVDQTLHFIGVPLRANWQFLERGRFSLYIGAGGMVEKCVSAKLGSKSFDEPGVQWSVLGAAGAQYRLGGLVGLYFEPEVSYYFTDTELRTSRTDSPLTLTLRFGVRLSF